jgi:hypothetical protein
MKKKKNLGVAATKLFGNLELNSLILTLKLFFFKKTGNNFISGQKIKIPLRKPSVEFII